MASGRRPFEGASSAELASAILRDAPRPLGDLRADLPADLLRLVRRCLEKDPDLRIQTARDIANELRELGGRTPRSGLAGTSAGAPDGSAAASSGSRTSGFGGRPAIAVLPFDNLSHDPEQEYFADGLAEDLITRLSLWRSFPVIARNSSFTYKGRTVDVKQVGGELGVRYLVRGSVRKAGSRVRVSAQLVDATDGHQVWAQTYDRELTDVFALQDEISEAIATPLVGDLHRAEHTRVQRQTPESLQAWELYQRALPLVYRFTRDDLTEAGALLERATVLDPHFATALACLADVRTWQAVFSWTDDPGRTLGVALELGRRAAALDPADSAARVSLAFTLMTMGDAFGAIEEGRRSVELNPSSPYALSVFGYLLAMTGHPPAESIALVHRAMRLSPRDPATWQFFDTLGAACFLDGRFAEGLEVSRRLIALSPTYDWGYLWGAMNAVGLGRIDEARELVRHARTIQPRLSIAHFRRALGAMAPDVERRMSDALRQAGVEES
jgi:adenylate cyclase